MGFGALQRQGSKYPNCSRICYLAFCGVFAHKPGCFEPLRTQRNHMFPTLALHVGFSDSCFRGWGDRRSRISCSNMHMKQSAAGLLVCLLASSTPHTTVHFSSSKLPPNSGTERNEIRSGCRLLVLGNAGAALVWTLSQSAFASASLPTLVTADMNQNPDFVRGRRGAIILDTHRGQSAERSRHISHTSAGEISHRKGILQTYGISNKLGKMFCNPGKWRFRQERLLAGFQAGC